MGAITIKSIRGRSQDYQPMEGDRSTGLTRVGGDDLELAMYREEDDDQTSLASQRGRTNRDYQLGYTDEGKRLNWCHKLSLLIFCFLL